MLYMCHVCYYLLNLKTSTNNICISILISKEMLQMKSRLTIVPLSIFASETALICQFGGGGVPLSQCQQFVDSAEQDSRCRDASPQVLSNLWCKVSQIQVLTLNRKMKRILQTLPNAVPLWRHLPFTSGKVCSCAGHRIVCLFLFHTNSETTA